MWTCLRLVLFFFNLFGVVAYEDCVVKVLKII